MKRWPIIAAGAAGAVTGFIGTVYVGMAVGLATSLTTTATVILLVICPVIYSIWWRWWLVPIFNALLYAGIAFGIAALLAKKAHRTG
jgi:hypothetical protein